MSRRERRRLEDVRKVKSKPESRGIGLGWRYTASGKGKYLVKEPPDMTVGELTLQSIHARTRMGML